MKKIKSVALLLFVFALTSCGSNNSSHEHSFNSSWSTDENSHWKDASCEHTDLSKDRGPHIDVNNDKKCDVCGYALHSSSSHVHTFDEEHWETTDTHHWHKATCEHTDLSSNLGEHIFGSNNVCTICGKLKTSTNPDKKYVITWKNYDGSILEVDNDVVEGIMPSFDGVTPVKPSSQSHSYSFSGWSPEVSIVTGNATYTAQFISNLNSYNVSWNVNGNIVNEKYEYGAIPFYKNGTPIKESTSKFSYTFKEWSPSLSAVNSDITYTAIFEENLNSYKVDFVNYDGSNLQSSYLPYGSVPIYNGNKPSKPSDSINSYTFAGWSPELVQVTDNITYFATYTTDIRSFLITFDCDGGTVDHNTVSIRYGDSYELPTPVKEGYSFDGWLYGYSFVAKKGIWNYSQDLTLIAKWSPINFTINYILNGSINHADNPITYNIESPTITLLNPIKNGFIFIGWKTSNNKYISTIESGSCGDLTLEAVWGEKIEYSISYHLNGGNNSQTNPTTYTIGSSIILQDATKSGSYFSGWYLSENFVGNPLTAISETTFGDLDLYAKWSSYTPSEPKVGDNIFFGAYPQSVSTAEVREQLVLSQPSSDGYYYYEGEAYYRSTAGENTQVRCGTFLNGTTIEFKDYFYKFEPISWKILKKNADGSYLLLCNNILDTCQYLSHFSSFNVDGINVNVNVYEYSKLRTFLNDDNGFYGRAFNDDCKKMIQTTVVDNSASTTSYSPNKYAAGTTNDKVFTFSYKDYLNNSYGFSTNYQADPSRCCPATDLVRSHLIASSSFGSVGATTYWTRSPAIDSGTSGEFVGARVSYIKTDGSVSTINLRKGSMGNETYYYGIRPAITIKL